MTRKIPVLICIDVEPDAREIDPDAREDWKGFEESFRVFQQFRPRAEDATGAPVHLSWFLRMDPQVALVYGSHAWAARRYAGLFAALESEGDEIGLHAHAWRWDESCERWVADYADQEWVSHCVRSSFESFEEAFGRMCASFRFGDHWMNDETLDLVERLGARFDLTVEPRRTAEPDIPPGENFTGSFLDYLNVPRAPYRPSRADFRKDRGVGNRGLWVFPVSMGQFPLWPAARFYRRAFWRLKYGRRKYLPISLNLPPTYFSRHVNEVIRESVKPREQGKPYLCLVMRTNGAVSAQYAAWLGENLDLLLTHPLARQVAFETPAEALIRLT
ncbi:MAG TPA: hypothetical protein VEX60_08430 [Pyrinomonadaceae bacterium]|nr:hypothetical protein [Pyrinomonadaceae bacterium]